MLDTDLDLMIGRKLGLPWQPEVATGAIARLEILPGATHPIEEPDTVKQTARLACRGLQETLNPRAGDHVRPATRLLHEQDPDCR
jgi:predicted phosphoribosyltransferase